MYAPTTPPSASGVLGSTPGASVVNVVQLFQYFFQAFGAACVFYVVTSYTLAFWHRRLTTPVRTLVRAAMVERADREGRPLTAGNAALTPIKPAWAA